ncbi:hypothetical protein ABIA35_001069 [Catenulispora sp. MAP12-49]|uniref:hypothetical protein n=1 Tax=Catenulispora sp. MAP12-49 TaxID=3156302 RepID=UPI0035126041
MPQFHNIEDAKRIIDAAWNAFDPHGRVHSDIGGVPVPVVWSYYSRTMDAGTDDVWEFTGNQGELTRWWTDFGPEYTVLPPEYKGRRLGYQINLKFRDPRDTWFNFHLTVPAP